VETAGVKTCQKLPCCHLNLCSARWSSHPFGCCEWHSTG